MSDNETLAILFHEEAAEHLATLETALLELESQPQDTELISRVFRALHSLKGSAAMAGLDVIAKLAHDTESIFAQVRLGKLRVSAEMIRLTLESKDVIRALVEPKHQVSAEARERLHQALHAILEPETKVAPPKQTLPSRAPSNPPGSRNEAHITWKPHPDFFTSGSNALGILNELDQMGSCQTTTNLDALPPLAALDPESCYLSYEIVLDTSRTEAEIRELFAFVDHRSDLNITMGASPGPQAQGTAPPVEAPKADTGRSVRVAAEKLDSLVDLVGELAIAQARLSQLSLSHHDESLLEVAEDIGRLSSALRDNTLDLRMVPIGSTFARLRRLVHDLSSQLGKDIELVTEGAGTELDKTMIEKLIDPLIHLIRNSCDHGIESPDARRRAGKNAVGTIRLSAYHSGQSVFIEIHDDGAGLDREAIRSRAVAIGLVSENATVSDHDLCRLIFLPDVSTAKTVTDVSGRGVGMDVVKRSIDALGGQIDLRSEPGQGVIVRIQLPLTLAIIEGLLVQVGEGKFILPMSMVEECIELTASDIERSHGNHLVNLRGSQVPYIRLREWFCATGELPGIEQVAITTLEGVRFGFVVDAILGLHQTVIKSLGRMFRKVQGLSGATILGDGSVALVIDVPSFVRSLALAA